MKLEKVFLNPKYYKQQLGHNEQRQPGNQVENYKKYFEYTQERIENQVKSFTGNREPPTLCSVYKIRGREENQGP